MCESTPDAYNKLIILIIIKNFLQKLASPMVHKQFTVDRSKKSAIISQDRHLLIMRVQ